MIPDERLRRLAGLWMRKADTLHQGAARALIRNDVQSAVLMETCARAYDSAAFQLVAVIELPH